MSLWGSFRPFCKLSSSPEELYWDLNSTLTQKYPQWYRINYPGKACSLRQLFCSQSSTCQWFSWVPLPKHCDSSLCLIARYVLDNNLSFLMCLHRFLTLFQRKISSKIVCRNGFCWNARSFEKFSRIVKLGFDGRRIIVVFCLLLIRIRLEIYECFLSYKYHR